MPPYSADTPLSIAYRHVNDDMPPPSEALPGLPPAVDDLVLRATRRDPALRPADADAFLTELAKTRASLGIAPGAGPGAAHRTAATGRLRTDQDRARAEANETQGTNATQAYWDPETVRARPVVTGPSPVGPSGTRALSRGEYQHMADQYRPPQVAEQPLPQQPVNRYEAQRDPQQARVRDLDLGGAAARGAGRGGRVVAGQRALDGDPAGHRLDPTVAEHAITTADLSVVLQQTHDNIVPAGQVINTDPVEGSRALRGASVTLLVSEGRPVVPDVTAGANVSAVEQAIKADQLAPRLDPTQSHSATPSPRAR